MKFRIGVDEAGRGPLAGPVAVGVVMAPATFDIRTALPGVGDSKVLTEKRREELYRQALIYRKNGDIDFCVRFVGPEVIDSIGITQAVKRGVWGGVEKLAAGKNMKDIHVMLDGLLAAPPEFSQETIIRGDATEAVISLASIVAKVSRDRLMCRLAQQFPAYDFHVHKGYGTKAHRAAIQKFGLSEVHRKSFCRSLYF